MPRLGFVTRSLARLGDWFGPRADRPADRPLHARRRLAIVGCALVVTVVCRVVCRFPNAVEALYSRAVGAVVTRAVSAVTGLIPFSVAEIFLVASVAYILGAILWTLVALVRKRRSVRNAFARCVLRTVVAASVFMALFLSLWGVNYARPAMAARMDWPALVPGEKGAVDREELARLCEELVEATNRNYELAMGSDDLGDTSGQDISHRDWEAPIDLGYRRAVEVLGADPALAWSRGRAKPVTGSWVMCWTKVLGFYFPWTAEANYNHLPPACELPHVIAHEKAHQRCITSEDEANFLGFLACVLSDDPYVRYSGYLFAYEKLTRELRAFDEEKARELGKSLAPGVKRDIRAGYEFWKPFRTEFDHVGAAVNDAYLRANGVEAGIRSYQLSAKLIVQFARANGGTCVVDTGADGQNAASQPPST